MKNAKRRGRKVKLGLEALDRRDVPSVNPYIAGFTVGFVATNAAIKTQLVADSNTK